MLPITRRRVFWGILGFLLAVLAGSSMVQCRGRENQETRMELSSPKKKTVYHCPMHPAMRSEKHGDCPICQMRMVPVEEEEAPAGLPQTSGFASLASKGSNIRDCLRRTLYSFPTYFSELRLLAKIGTVLQICQQSRNQRCNDRSFFCGAFVYVHSLQRYFR